MFSGKLTTVREIMWYNILTTKVKFIALDKKCGYKGHDFEPHSVEAWMWCMILYGYHIIVSVDTNHLIIVTFCHESSLHTERTTCVVFD